MDIAKIERFQLDNPGQSFPPFRRLNAKESEEIRESIMGKLSLDRGTSGLALANRVLELSVALEGPNAEAEGFSLLPVFEELCLKPQESVYVNWYRYDNIDSVAFKDLVAVFDYVWYPAADDIDLFDASLNWILSITHYGQICILKLDSE